jgi:hypothetical protein
VWSAARQGTDRLNRRRSDARTSRRKGCLHRRRAGAGSAESRHVFVDHAMPDRYGFGDAISLAERILFFSQPDDQGWVHLFPVQRRAGFADGSAADGWLRPPGPVTGDRDCPCGSERPYSACHGAVTPASE